MIVRFLPLAGISIFCETGAVNEREGVAFFVYKAAQMIAQTVTNFGADLPTGQRRGSSNFWIGP